MSRECCLVLRAVCFKACCWCDSQAVHTIHEERIVHSDLKPANFLVVEGQLKLIDFGIAKAISSDTTSIAREAQVHSCSFTTYCLSVLPIRVLLPGSNKNTRLILLEVHQAEMFMMEMGPAGGHSQLHVSRGHPGRGHQYQRRPTYEGAAPQSYHCFQQDACSAALPSDALHAGRLQRVPAAAATPMCLFRLDVCIGKR